MGGLADDGASAGLAARFAVFIGTAGKGASGPGVPGGGGAIDSTAVGVALTGGENVDGTSGGRASLAAEFGLDDVLLVVAAALDKGGIGAFLVALGPVGRAKDAVDGAGKGVAVSRGSHGGAELAAELGGGQLTGADLGTAAAGEGALAVARPLADDAVDGAGLAVAGTVVTASGTHSATVLRLDSDAAVADLQALAARLGARSQAFQEARSQSTGQAWLLHTTMPYLEGQALPPYTGAVKERVRVWEPPPQEWVHSSKPPQVPTSQSTGHLWWLQLWY